MDTQYNSYGCIPGKRCNCPLSFATCSAWVTLYSGSVTKGFYRDIAFTSVDSQLERLGWDMVLEGLAECVTLDDVRSNWKFYQTKMYAALAERDSVMARFYAWAMVACENKAEAF